MAEPAGAKPIMDVSQPGRTAPTASSRPIIVSHAPSVQDPMMSAPSANKTEQVAEKPPFPQTPATQTQPNVSPPSAAPVASDTTNHFDIKQHVHDKTYFSPVTEPPKRHGMPWIFILPALILLAAGLYVVFAIL